MGDALSYGRWLRDRRKALDLTQVELARRLGRATVTVRKLEADKLRPSKLTAERLAGILGVTSADTDGFLRPARDAPDDLASITTLHAVERTGAPTREVLLLPLPRTRFIGRERELAEIAQLLEVARLVTLAGPGGCGKTRLALEVARRLGEGYPDGVWFVDLAPLADPTLVAPTVAAALRLRERPDQPVEAALLGHLRSRCLLLLLDNCEHLIDACARLVATMLDACPDVRILATSRETLRLGGEVVHRVPPLATLHPSDFPGDPAGLLAVVEESEAAALFVDRARAVQPGFALARENARGVADICHRLDGIPLAIELAAARINVLSPAELLDRLGNRFRILTGGPRDLPVRQQTLWNTIAWSYDLLGEGEKTLYRRLSAFTGGCTLGAVEAVGSNLPIDPLDGLTSLVNQSMLHRDETRFAMLETIREYGRSLLTRSGEENAIRGRHAGYFLALVEDCVRRHTSVGPGSLTWDSRLEPEQANLRAALAWFRDNDPVLGLRLAAGLGWFWVGHADRAEGEEWLSNFLARTPGDPGVRGRALLGLATIKRDRGDLAGAQPLFEESLALCRQMGDQWGIGRSLIQLSQQARSMGDYDRGIALAEESLALAREIEVQDSLLWGLAGLGQVHRLRGDFGRARAFLEEARRLAPRELFPLYELGLTVEDEGEYDRAEALFQEGLAQEKRATWPVGEWQLRLARVKRKRGDRVRARRWCDEALALARQTGRNHYICLALYDLAVLDWGDNDPLRGRARLAEGLDLARQGRDRQTLAVGILLGAHHAFEIGELVRAIRLFGAADTVIPGYRFEWDNVERATYERSLAAARAALDPDVGASAWAEGHAMTLERVIADVLSPSEPEIAPVPRATTRGGSTLPLTPREQTVASLVARGLTNRQIAEQLIISRGTAETHVKNILQKLNFHARAEIAVWAERNGLLAASP